jgi:glycosyltransferase involved in cell wall biosynthesis
VAVYCKAQEHYAKAPYPIHPIHARWWGRFQGFFAWARVAPDLQAGDVVLCATWPLASCFTPRAECPLLISAHGSDLTRPPRYGNPKTTLAKASAFLPVSHFLGRLSGRSYTVVPYPLPEAPLVRSGEKLLVVARLTPLKGVDRAIRLAKRLGRPITIVGDGPERSGLEKLALELGVHAVFTGKLAPEQIPWEETWALALFSQPDTDGSGAEGLGLVFLEAAARGIPSLGSTTGGIPEVASLTLLDPEHDEIPTLPDRQQLQQQTRALYSPEQTVSILHRAVNRL